MESEYDDYVETHSYSDSEYNALHSDYSDYKSTHYHSDAGYDALEDQRDWLRAPKLREVGLESMRLRNDSKNYLLVFGYVCNVGTDVAYNSTLHVEAFQGNVLAFNTTTSLGTIAGELYVPVHSGIFYDGETLASWHIWSQPEGIGVTGHVL